jgi:hypothetical protein
MKRGECKRYAHPSLSIGRRIMGRVKPGDTVAIKNPERHSLVKAGKLILQGPDILSMRVPDNISRPDLKVLDSLVDWGIILVNEEPLCLLQQDDPLMSELVTEYDEFTVSEAIDFLRKLSTCNIKKFLDYESKNKNRTTVLKAFIKDDLLIEAN